jgi:hypothetical protein
MRNSDVESAGQVVAALLARGEFGTDSPAWDILKDEEVLLAVETLLSQMGARLSITHDRCYLVPTDASSPLLRGVKRMADVFRDQGRDSPGRANLMAVITLAVLGKLLDPASEDGLSQAGRGGVVPMSTMVGECEDAFVALSRRDDLSDYMRAALAEWDRSSRPGTGRANVSSHEGYVRYVVGNLAARGILTVDGDEGSTTCFGPTGRLVAQAREVLDAERYREISVALSEEE